MVSLSRRERRVAAKKLGLLSKKESYSEMTQRFKRSKEAGSQIHTKHIQEIQNSKFDVIVGQTGMDENPDETSEFINPYGFLGKKF